MNDINYATAADAEALGAKLAEDVAALLRDAVKNKGYASMAVSGGSTPLPFFSALEQCAVPWDKLTITLADERCVDADHADSNARFVRKNLLSGAGKVATFLPLYFKPEQEEAESDEGIIAKADDSLKGIQWPLDVVVLGMGEDAHTASLFPEVAGLSEALDLNSGSVCHTLVPSAAPHKRITLGLKALLNAEQVILHIVGDKKRGILEKVVSESDSVKAPVSALFDQKLTPLTVYWSA